MVATTSEEVRQTVASRAFSEMLRAYGISEAELASLLARHEVSPAWLEGLLGRQATWASFDGRPICGPQTIVGLTAVRAEPGDPGNGWKLVVVFADGRRACYILTTISRG